MQLLLQVAKPKVHTEAVDGQRAHHLVALQLALSMNGANPGG